MLNAVWVAVVVALAAWVVLAAMAVVALARFSRLVTEARQAVDGLRQRGDELIERGNAAVSRAGEQLTRTEAITASMDQVTAGMAELTGRVAALAPLARKISASARGPAGWVLAFGYGVNRAVSLRRGAAGRVGTSRGARTGAPGPLADGHRKALPGVQAGSVAARGEGQ
jgi:hypothetical protein